MEGGLHATPTVSLAASREPGHDSGDADVRVCPPVWPDIALVSKFASKRMVSDFSRAAFDVDLVRKQRFVVGFEFNQVGFNDQRLGLVAKILRVSRSYNWAVRGPSKHSSYSSHT
jgi:hypothetical protein